MSLEKTKIYNGIKQEFDVLRDVDDLFDYNLLPDNIRSEFEAFIDEEIGFEEITGITNKDELTYKILGNSMAWDEMTDEDIHEAGYNFTKEEIDKYVGKYPVVIVPTSYFVTMRNKGLGQDEELFSKQIQIDGINHTMYYAKYLSRIRKNNSGGYELEITASINN